MPSSGEHPHLTLHSRLRCSPELQLLWVQNVHATPQATTPQATTPQVDYISVEWHTLLCLTHARFAPLRLHPKQRLDLGTQGGATRVTSLLQAAMADGGRAAGCLTNVFEVDDESYLHDGMPLPVSL